MILELKYFDSKLIFARSLVVINQRNSSAKTAKKSSGNINASKLEIVKNKIQDMRERDDSCDQSNRINLQTPSTPQVIEYSKL